MLFDYLIAQQLLYPPSLNSAAPAQFGHLAGTFDLPATLRPAVPAFKLEEATVGSINKAFDSGALTSTQLVQLYLNRIATYDQQGIELGSVLSLNPNALAQAAALDVERRTKGPRSPLHGIPILLKDNIGTTGLATTAGAVGLQNFMPPDAFIVKQLREAGAIVLGKANLSEFAYYISTTAPDGFSALGGFTYNPYDPTRLPDGLPALNPGGSSSGSAVAVAANLVTLSVGTETSGSILYPASLNAVVGIKPTVGLLSRSGIIPGSLSQDSPGPMARTVTDAAILLGVMVGVDPQDPATLGSRRKFYRDYTPFLNRQALAGKRIGVPQDVYWDTLTVGERAVMNRSIQVLQSLGATIVYENIATARAEFNTANNYVGIYPTLDYEFKRDFNRYLAGFGNAAPFRNLGELIAYNNADPTVRIPYGQAEFEAANSLDLVTGLAKYQQERATDLREGKDGLDQYISQYRLDGVLFPESLGTSIGDKAGYPSIVVPAGYAEAGKPYGVAFLGKAYSEPALLGYAYAFEQANPARRPPTSTPALPGDVIVKPKPTHHGSHYGRPHGHRDHSHR
jgi:amidase